MNDIIQTVITLIQNTGVPVATCIYFMFRDYKFMGQLQTTLQALVSAVDCINKHFLNEKGIK